MTRITIHQLSQLPADQLDTRTAFDCGHPALNNYLAHTASQHEKKFITRTFCAIKHGTIVGYGSLTNSEVNIGALPPDVIKRYRLPTHNMPVVRLCRLAVDATSQGQGIGSTLLMAALERVLSVAAASGCVGMVVDAKDAEAARYYEGFGFRPAPDNQRLLFMPLPDIQELFRAP